ncbi:Piso0_001950 [Millerozyma farinosa CBS 7064]|uniref:Piso0_001950 protein n=1 Tax=Pichia sorbitophila (strain ATCC MYA-4447 / BCRC 22081 / CBS 7064 / NBRC 10061 / NRRL Y-12695) TaxID=559304 RepID=G8YM49_PICSO|nr:Piso0_001950 [Millerozyma farinosa CBS 7064]
MPQSEQKQASIAGEPGIVIPQNPEAISALSQTEGGEKANFEGLSPEEKKKQKKKVKRNQYKAKKKKKGTAAGAASSGGQNSGTETTEGGADTEVSQTPEPEYPETSTAGVVPVTTVAVDSEKAEAVDTQLADEKLTNKDEGENVEEKTDKSHVAEAGAASTAAAAAAASGVAAAYTSEIPDGAAKDSEGVTKDEKIEPTDVAGGELEEPKDSVAKAFDSEVKPQEVAETSTPEVADAGITKTLDPKAGSVEKDTEVQGSTLASDVPEESKTPKTDAAVPDAKETSQNAASEVNGDEEIIVAQGVHDKSEVEAALRSQEGDITVEEIQPDKVELNNLSNNAEAKDESTAGASEVAKETETSKASESPKTTEGGKATEGAPKSSNAATSATSTPQKKEAKPSATSEETDKKKKKGFFSKLKKLFK